MTEWKIGETAESKKLETFKILKYFKYQHLPPHLQAISKPFSDLAHEIADRYMEIGKENNFDIAETIAGLRKVLEAKDCIVRSVI
jgi:hypothetical protein